MFLTSPFIDQAIYTQVPFSGVSLAGGRTLGQKLRKPQGERGDLRWALGHGSYVSWIVTGAGVSLDCCVSRRASTRCFCSTPSAYFVR